MDSENVGKGEIQERNRTVSCALLVSNVVRVNLVCNFGKKTESFHFYFSAQSRVEFRPRISCGISAGKPNRSVCSCTCDISCQSTFASFPSPHFPRATATLPQPGIGQSHATPPENHIIGKHATGSHCPAISRRGGRGSGRFHTQNAPPHPMEIRDESAKSKGKPSNRTAFADQVVPGLLTALLSSGNTPGIDYGALAQIQNPWRRRRRLLRTV